MLPSGLVFLVAFASPSFAQTDDDANDDRITGQQAPPLLRAPEDATAPDAAEDDEAKPFPAKAYRGAESLHMPVAFIHGVQTGLELLYTRHYKATREHFAALDEAFPGTAARPMMDAIVWQALMFENFDYRYQKQYETAAKEARKALDAAQKVKGNEAWEHLLLGTLDGLDAIRKVRLGSYISALQTAFGAMDHIEKSRAAADNFIDLQLADGLYNYWRSAVTLSTKALPDFGDQRVEGIEQMRSVEASGFFVAPLASLGLAYSWVEQGDVKSAVAACERIRSKYPNNIIANLVTATIYIYRKQYDKAIALTDHVLKIDPKNDRAHYTRGLAQARKGDTDAAHASYARYLQGQHLEKSQVAYAHYRIGQVHAQQKSWSEAAESYERAIKASGLKGAKRALDRLKERRKQGKIDF